MMKHGLFILLINTLKIEAPRIALNIS